MRADDRGGHGARVPVDPACRVRRGRRRGERPIPDPPASRRRWNRLDPVPTRPWRCGRSRRGAPGRGTHEMPFTVRRWSSFGRPVRGRPPGWQPRPQPPPPPVAQAVASHPRQIGPSGPAATPSQAPPSITPKRGTQPGGQTAGARVRACRHPRSIVEPARCGRTGHAPARAGPAGVPGLRDRGAVRCGEAVGRHLGRSVPQRGGRPRGCGLAIGSTTLGRAVIDGAGGARLRGPTTPRALSPTAGILSGDMRHGRPSRRAVDRPSLGRRGRSRDRPALGDGGGEEGRLRYRPFGLAQGGRTAAAALGHGRPCRARAPGTTLLRGTDAGRASAGGPEALHTVAA